MSECVCVYVCVRVCVHMYVCVHIILRGICNSNLHQIAVLTSISASHDTQPTPGVKGHTHCHSHIHVHAYTY